MVKYIKNDPSEELFYLEMKNGGAHEERGPTECGILLQMHVVVMFFSSLVNLQGAAPQLIITTFYLTEFEECAWIVCLISQRNTAGFHLTKQIDKLFRCALPVVYPVSPLLFRYFSCIS